MEMLKNRLYLTMSNLLENDTLRLLVAHYIVKIMSYSKLAAAVATVDSAVSKDVLYLNINDAVIQP